MPSNSDTQIILQLGKEKFPATYLKGEEYVSQPFHYRAEFLAPFSFDVRDFPGTQVTLEFIAPDGYTRRATGWISLIEETETLRPKTKQKGIRIDVVPRMSFIKEHHDQQIILGHTATDIARLILEKHGYRPDQLKFHLGANPPIQPYTVQVEQSDFDFLQRVLAKNGIFYYFDCETREEVTFETIHFLDATSFCPYLKRGMVRYFPPSGMQQTFTTQNGSQSELFTSLYDLQEHRTLVPGEWAYHDHFEQTPETELFATRNSGTEGKLKTPGKQIKFGDGSLSLDEIDRQARFAADRAQIKAHHVSAIGNIADVATGRLMSLDASKLMVTITGDYLITKVIHTLDQKAAHDLNDEPGPEYRCELSLTPRDLSYRPDLPERPKELPMTFTARIESDGKYASLDSSGRYNLRKLLDLGDKPHTQATHPPLRKLEPYAGPMQTFKPGKDGTTPKSIPTGMHFPLQDGDEVLLSCLNEDPDRPMIVGAHYDANRPSPVTSANKSENRLRTQSDNELLMDDKIDNEVIKLCTYEGFNILQFDAKKADHMIRMATEHGAMHMFAKQTFYEKSGDTHEERSGNDRIQVVENKSVTTTKNKEIHYQTPTDILQNAGTNIKHTATDNIEIEAYENQVIVVEDENMEITVEGPGGMRIHIKNDDLHIQVAKEIRIEGNGGGDITFHQAGGGACVTAGGDVKLFGNNVQIEGTNGVTFNGNVRYTVGPPPPGPAPVADPSLLVQQFALLQAAQSGKPFCKVCAESRRTTLYAYNLAWNTTQVPVGETVNATFTVRNQLGGEEVELNIFEWDPNRVKTAIKSEKIILERDKDDYELEFTRQEDEANYELNRGNTIELYEPMSFSFNVVINDKGANYFSPKLTLTTDVSFDLVDDNKRPYKGEIEVECIQSNGESVFQNTSNSKVTFKNIVLGPVEICVKPVSTNMDSNDQV